MRVNPQTQTLQNHAPRASKNKTEFFFWRALRGAACIGAWRSACVGHMGVSGMFPGTYKKNPVKIVSFLRLSGLLNCFSMDHFCSATVRRVLFSIQKKCTFVLNLIIFTHSLQPMPSMIETFWQHCWQACSYTGPNLSWLIGCSKSIDIYLLNLRKSGVPPLVIS
jgi:hypothetical protein